MSFAEPIRLGLDEFGRDERAFDGTSYLYANEDVRREIGFDVEGAWRHWASVGHRQGRYPPGLGRTAPRHLDPIAMAARPFGLNVFGPFEAVSGLGTAARNLLEAVRASGVAFDLHPYDVEAGHARLTAAELDNPVRYRINLVFANADQIRRLAGLYPDGTFDDAYTIAVWAWELAAFRPDWHASFALVDEIWTNSRFELASIAASSPVPVHLMPLPVLRRPEIDHLAARARFGLPEDAFILLCAFDAGSTEQRKNPFAAIETFRAAFGTDPRHVLVVKHHGAALDLSRRLLAARRGAANIRLIGGRLSEAHQHALQAACDGFLSPHRSEGFGLNLAEFIAAGGSVIGTDYSGNRDFLDETTGYPVAATLREVGRRSGPYLEHAVWSEPDVAALASMLRRVAADVAGRRARGEAGRARMADAFSPEAIGARMHVRLSMLPGLRTPDGFAATSLASTSSFVPRDEARARIAWPARLPMFTIVRAGTNPVEDWMRAQLYPFWEACLVSDSLPPPEDAAARAALRGHDLRVRLVGHCPDRPAAIAAAEAATGSWLVLMPEGEGLDAAALLSIARLLDRDDAPGLIMLGAIPRVTPPLAIRKTCLLAAWSAGPGTIEDVLRRIADGGAHRSHLPLRTDADPEPGPRLPAHARLSVRFRTEAARAAWDGAEQEAEAVDTGSLATGGDVRSHARAIERGLSAEHVVLVEDAHAVTGPAAARRLAGWLADRGIDAVATRGAFAARRRLLARIARLSPPASFEEAASSLGAIMVRLPPVAMAEADGPDPDLSLASAEHAARIASLGLFDADHYLVSAPDVAASGTDPLRHYVDYGWREHRAPNFYFDPVWYRARYMDEDAALDPLLHYARFRNSGVRPSRHFDPSWVRRSRHLAPGVDPLRYFLERRRIENVSPLPEFDPAWYRARRRDIVYRQVDPFEHYMRFGAAEGVNPSADFDTAFYAARNMGDVGRRDPVANNPLLHYLENRDRQPAITSLKAALRQEIARLQLLGRSFIEMSFCWFDGLPQRIDALRTYLAEPTLAMPFLLVFANGMVAAAARAGDERLSQALRLPLTDEYDDPDICARLAECFRDPRCLRRDGRPVLAIVRGPDGALVDAFALRLARLLAADHGLVPAIELLD